jgi:AhpD family alkylhydroperoxidase
MDMGRVKMEPRKYGRHCRDEKGGCMQEGSKKRIYGLKGFFSDGISLLMHLPELVDTLRSGRVSKSFREKLNMAVISVLGCRYCNWLHSEMALSHGVAVEELKNLLIKELGDFPAEQAVALAFAQHYSESGGLPGKEAEQKFHEFYDRETAKDILLYIKIIYLGNLAGNTVDAFLSRISGKPHEDGSFLSELVIFILAGPYYLLMLPLLALAFHYKTQNR